MTVILAVLSFVLGSAIGSFLSVLIYRLRHKIKGIWISRSICPYCKKKLKWHYLIPIFSWLFLRGKCGYCGKKISIHYLLLELVTGLTFLTIFLNWNFLSVIPSITNPEILNYAMNWIVFEKFIFYLILFTLLVLIFFYDLLYKEIPDKFSITAIVIAFLGGLFFAEPTLVNMLIGGAILGLFFALQFIISKGKWIGGGDIRMGVLMGVLLGWDKGLLALALAYLMGAVLSVYLLLTKKAGRKSEIAFGPFLTMGVTIGLLFGNQILDWYFNVLLF